MATPEQDYDGSLAITKLGRAVAAGGVTLVGTGVWVYSQIFGFATWRADEEHYKEALTMRIETIEAHARLHAAGQHDKTRRQRTKDVRELLKQLESIDAELVKLAPGKRRETIREKLREHRVRLTDSMVGD
jgi:hypothetical protein